MRFKGVLHFWTLSDRFLSKYGLLKNYNAKILSFGYVLDFDLLPHPLAWTLKSDIVEWTVTLQGIYGASTNVFLQVIVKIWTSRKSYLFDMY